MRDMTVMCDMTDMCDMMHPRHMGCLLECHATQYVCAIINENGLALCFHTARRLSAPRRISRPRTWTVTGFEGLRVDLQSEGFLVHLSIRPDVTKVPCAKATDSPRILSHYALQTWSAALVSSCGVYATNARSWCRVSYSNPVSLTCHQPVPPGRATW